MRFECCPQCDSIAMDPTPELSDQERDEAEGSIRAFATEALLEREKSAAATLNDHAPW